MSRRPLRVALLALSGLVTAAWILVGLEKTVGDPRYVDDAFISFHYARSLIAGDGFVYNVEDGPLEGFTNFLWVLICAGLMKLGAAPEVAMRALGLGAWAASVASLAWALHRLSARASVRLAQLLLLGAMALPFGFVALAGSGLETAATSHTALGLGALHIDERPLAGRRWALASALQITAFLLRLDSVVFLAAFSFALVLGEAPRRGLRGAIVVATLRQLPVVLAGLAFLAFKLAYFGDVFPNTYYAKSASASSFEAGLEYWKVFLRNSPQTVPLLALALLAAIRGRGALRWRNATNSSGVVAARYALLGVALYALYVAKVGGDFMFWRFAFEVYPLLVFGALVGLARLGEWLRAAPLRDATHGALVAVSLYGSMADPVLENRYGMQSIDLMHAFVVEGTMVAHRLDEVLPPNVRIATTLAGVIRYYTRGYVMDQWGLNDRVIAHRPDVEVRGRGHVKKATTEEMIDRGIHLVVDHPDISPCAHPRRAAQPSVYIRLEDGLCLRAWYLVEEPALTELFCTSADFFTEGVDCRGGEVPTFRSAELEARPIAREVFLALAASPERLARWTFDALPPGATTRGAAFGDAPARRAALPGQQRVTGHIGPYLNGFHGGDSTTGVLSVAIPDGATEVAALVGGSDDCERVFAGLAVGDRIIARACGQRDEVLRPVAWRLPRPASNLTFVAVDTSSAAWGHLLVDELVVQRGTVSP
jgi:hypothetical protein